jgi:tight adherence protein B
MFVIVAFIIFSVALGGVAYYVWAIPEQEEARVLASRLRNVRGNIRTRSRTAPDLLHREDRGTFAFLGDVFNWIGLLRRLQIYIRQANLKYRAQDVFVLCIVLAVLTYLILTVAGVDIFLLRLLFAALVGYTPVFFVARKRAGRLGKFEENLPDAIDLFTRTMRAGHNIHSGLETIAEETSNPIKMEFRKVMEEIALGQPLEPALHGLGERIPILDLKFFITGLILQRQTGANMVAVLENLSTLVRERLNMAAKMMAHTAQQRFSAALLCLMPIVVGLGMWLLKPEYIRLLYQDPVGQKFLTYAVISEIVGILVIRKLANIKA